MSFVNQSKTKRLVAVHGWSGMILGLVLYVVVLTGAIVVFASEIGAWSAGGRSASDAFSQPIDARFRELSESVAPEYREEVVAFTNSGGDIVAFFHTHEERESGGIEDKGVRFYLDGETLEIKQRYEGFVTEMPTDPEGALDDFITDVHINLYMPRPWGLYATGILGIIMLIAAISGILVHRHILKELFLSPRKSSALLFRKDKHVLAGSWSLPFAFLLAFTGSFFSFATTIGLPVVAMVAFDGDQEQMIETLIGVEAEPNETPAPLANLDQLLAASRTNAGTDAQSIAIAHWGRADAMVTLFHPAAEGELTGDTHLFNGVTSEYLGIKPIIGSQPSLGGAIVGLIGPLHFGNYAGLLGKIVWLALGFALCYVTLTGLQMWVERREEAPVWRRIGRVIPAVGYGTAIGMVGAAYAYFATIHSTFDPHYWVAMGALCTFVGSLAPAFTSIEPAAISRLLRRTLGIGMVFLPAARMISGGPHWIDAFSMRGWAIIGVDLVLIVGGAVAILGIRRIAKREVQLPVAEALTS
ncbi:MAG: PepSY-associated TM helix domain-containing protein [Pseudomonadota bacterium]